MNTGRAEDQTSDLLFSSPQRYRLSYGSRHRRTRLWSVQQLGLTIISYGECNTILSAYTKYICIGTKYSVALNNRFGKLHLSHDLAKGSLMHLRDRLYEAEYRLIIYDRFIIIID